VSSGHAGKDGRLYVLDTARVYPPTPPSSVMRALFIRADKQQDLTSHNYIDSINLTIPQYEKEARQLLVTQAKDRDRSETMAKQKAEHSLFAGIGAEDNEDRSSLTDDQLAFRIEKCILPMGGVMFYEGRGNANMVASYLAHREIRGNAVIIPAGYAIRFSSTTPCLRAAARVVLSGLCVVCTVMHDLDSKASACTISSEASS
jgi:hypothetical protein